MSKAKCRADKGVRSALPAKNYLLGRVPTNKPLEELCLMHTMTEYLTS